MIGVFDSGIGGLSVLAEIRASLPAADLLYVADRARAPYGRRRLEDVSELSHEVAVWLRDRGCSTIVVACNTASAAALHSLRDRFAEIPIVGMEPGVKPAAALTNSHIVAVFATAATFQGELFDSVVDRHAADKEIITTTCASWVDLVESGVIEGPEAEEMVSVHVRPAVDAGADVIVLGCTHFSFLKPAIARAAGPDVTIYDPAPAVAAQVARVATRSEGSGRLMLAGSGDLSALRNLADRIAGIQADGPLLAFPG